MSRTVVLLNPSAQGGRARQRFSQIEAITRGASRKVQVFASERAAHACDWIRALPLASRVIVAGGDGTVQGLLPALIEGGHALGVLPLGSGNDAARVLGSFGNDWRDTLQRLLRSEKTRGIDVGIAQFDGRTVHFLVALNAGFDAAVAQRAASGLPQLHGLPKYLLATFRELISLRHWRVEIAIDNQTVHRGETLFASTLNAPTYGSGMLAVPHALVDDGALDLLVARKFSRVGALAMLPKLLRGTHLGDPRVSTHPFRTMKITSDTPLPLAADGEYLGATQVVEISIKAKFIQAIMIY